MDPIFGKLNELLVMCGNVPVFSVSLCKVLYFEDHYHAYVISVTDRHNLYCHLLDHNVSQTS